MPHLHFFWDNERLLIGLLSVSSIFYILTPVQLVVGAFPVWLKEGVYVQYEFKSNRLSFLNGTNIKFPFEGTLRWECIGLQGNIAQLILIFTLRERESQSPSRTLRLSSIVNVDTETQYVTLQNGTSIGKTRLWLPANPSEGEPIVIGNWTISKVSVDWANQDTPQGAQRVFTVPGGFYDLDTGIMTSGDLTNDATSRALNIAPDYGMPFLTHISDTNIDLEPRDLWPEFVKALPILLPIVAFAGVSITLIRRRMKRRQRQTKTSQNQK